MKEAALLGCFTEINTQNRMQDIIKFSLIAQCILGGVALSQLLFLASVGLVLLESFTPGSLTPSVLTRAQRVLQKSGGEWSECERRSISQGRTVQL